MVGEAQAASVGGFLSRGSGRMRGQRLTGSATGGAARLWAMETAGNPKRPIRPGRVTGWAQHGACRRLRAVSVPARRRGSPGNTDR